jgi:hypothetical protein
MNALLERQVRLSPKMRLDNVEPGEIGAIFAVEPMPAQTGPAPMVRIRFAKVDSGWLRPGQYERVDCTLFLFRIPVSVGADCRFMLVAAPDRAFAQMKAARFCVGTKWQVASTASDRGAVQNAGNF